MSNFLTASLDNLATVENFELNFLAKILWKSFRNGSCVFAIVSRFPVFDPWYIFIFVCKGSYFCFICLV